MDVIVQLLSITNIMLCLAVVALVWMQRKGAELLVSWIGSKLGKDWNLKNSKAWTEFLVPIGPIGTSMLLMLVPGVPVMAMFAVTVGTKLIFGLGLGLLSGLVYKLIKKNILEKMGKTEENDDTIDYSK